MGVSPSGTPAGRHAKPIRLLETLNEWVKKAEVDAGKRAGVPTDMAAKRRPLSGRTASFGRPTRSCVRHRRILMAWMPSPDGITMCQRGDLQKASRTEGAPKAEIAIIGIDLAKRLFQVHGATADGSVAFRKKLSRERLLPFLTAHPRCIVAMEACATAHDWARAIAELGHTVR